MGQQLLDAKALDLESATTNCYVVLVVDRLRLVVPQPQIYALEPVFDVAYLNTTSTNDNFHVPITELGIASYNAPIIGQIAVDDIKWPVYCLSGELNRLQEIPANRRICVLFHITAGLFGLLCDQVILVDWSDEVEIRPLPTCMSTSNSKLQGLILQGEEIYCIVSAEDLLAYCTVQAPLQELA